MTVAGNATLGKGQLLKTVAECAAGTAGDSLADTAAETAPITSLIDLQISVSDLLPHITLLYTFLFRIPHYYMLISKTCYKRMNSRLNPHNLTSLLPEY